MFLESIFDGENDAHSLRSQFSVLLCEKVANAYETSNAHNSSYIYCSKSYCWEHFVKIGIFNQKCIYFGNLTESQCKSYSNWQGPRFHDIWGFDNVGAFVFFSKKKTRTGLCVSDEVVETNMLHYFFSKSVGSPPRNLKLDAKWPHRQALTL